MRASIEAGLKEVSDLLPEARRLADMPRGRFPLRYADNPLETVPFDIAEARLVVLLLRYDSLLLAQKGDIDGALRSARALINSARAVGDEPLADSQVMRMGRVVVGCAAIERALAQGVASEKELAAVQHLLELEAQHPTEQIVARGVRATRFDFYEKALGGKQSMATVNPYFASSNLSWWEQVFGRRVSRCDQIADLRLTTKYVESTRLLNHEQAAVQLRLDEEMSQLAQESNGALIHFDSTMDPSLSRGKKALVRCMMATVAVERFRLATGKWPASLEQLTPKYLTEVPLDPHDGKPLVYERSTEGVTVFCQQKRHIDGDRQMAIGPTAPMGYRLWDVDKRRQPAKARPKEEIPP